MNADKFPLKNLDFQGLSYFGAGQYSGSCWFHNLHKMGHGPPELCWNLIPLLMELQKYGWKIPTIDIY